MYRGRGRSKKGNSRLRPSKAKNNPKKEINPELVEPRKVFVASISKWVTDADLAGSLSRYAEIESAFIVRKDGPRYYGFVTTNSDEDTKKLLDLHGVVLNVSNPVPIVIQPAIRHTKLPGMYGYKKVSLSELEFDLEPLEPDVCSIHVLFDEIILRLFNSLSVKQIIQCEQVCRRWQVLVHQYFQEKFRNSIQKNITYWIAEHNMKYNIQSFSKVLILCGDSLKSLELSGSASQNFNIKALTVIAQLCPSLESIKLRCMDKMAENGLQDLFRCCSGLKSFHIKDSFGGFTLKHLKILLQKSKLRKLDIRDVDLSNFEDFGLLPEDLKEFSFKFKSRERKDNEKLLSLVERCPNLELMEINLSNVYNSAFINIAKCQNLTTLKIEFERIDQLDLNFSFPHLKVLYVKGDNIPNFNKFIECFPDIEELNLSKLHQDLDRISFAALKNLTKLATPDTYDGCSIDGETLDSILQCQKLEMLILGPNEEDLLKFIKALPSLKLLVCPRYDFSQDDAAKFLSACKKRQSVLTIKVRHIAACINKEELNKGKLRVELIDPEMLSDCASDVTDYDHLMYDDFDYFGNHFAYGFDDDDDDDDFDDFDQDYLNDDFVSLLQYLGNNDWADYDYPDLFFEFNDF